MNAGGSTTALFSMDPEAATVAIKRFALSDSSDDDDNIHVPATAAGAGNAFGNRFDNSKLDWSRLLDDSSDSTSTPPLRAKPALATQLTALGGPTSRKDSMNAAPASTAAKPPTSATAAPAAAAATSVAAATTTPLTKNPSSSFRQLALLDSDDSVDGRASEGTKKPPPPPPSSRPKAAKLSANDKRPRLKTPLSLIPQTSVDVSAASPLLPPPSSMLVVPPTETLNESAATARSLTLSRPDSKAALPSTVTNTTTTAAEKNEESSATAAAPATVTAVQAPPQATPSSATPNPTAHPTKLHSTQRRPAALKKPESQAHGEEAKSVTAATALAATPRAAEPDPLSPGMVYTTVPQWTKGMKKKNGVYVNCHLLANPTALYERGLKGLKRAEEKRAELRAKLEEEERSATTFHPVISPRASAMKRGARFGLDGATAAEQETAQQLRHRLQLLELPEETAAVRRHSPRLSTTSERIVQECRERSGCGAAMTPGERLYQDFFYRQEAMEAAQQALQPGQQQGSALVRSQREIDEHIAALYAFEEHRRHAIAIAQEAPLLISPRAPPQVYVDPVDLVQRLTRATTPSPRRAARALLEKDECTFQPQANANAAELAKAARQRDLQRWVRYFGGPDTLTLSALLDYTGPATREAQCLVAALSQRDPSKMEWTAEELATVLAGPGGVATEQLWRRRPPGTEGTTSAAGGSDFTFHPALNVNSAAIVEGMEAEQRCGPTHDRLFLAAKSKQLSRRQQELEAEQAALEEAQRKQAKKARLQVEWRERERRRLEAYREEKALRKRSETLILEQPQNQAATEAEAAPLSTQSSKRKRQAQQTSRRHHLLSTSPREGEGRVGESVDGAAQRQSSPLPPTTPVGEVSRTATRASSSPAPTSKPDAAAVPLSCCVPPSSSRLSADETARHPRQVPPTEPATVPLLRTTSLERHAASEQQNAPIQATVEAPTGRNSWELATAAETLRRLLKSSTRSSTHSSGSLAPTTTSLSHPPPAGSAPIKQHDVNCPRDGKPGNRHLDVVLECATLRDPATVSSVERVQLERAQKRQLRELGLLLYNRNRTRVDNK